MSHDRYPQHCPIGRPEPVLPRDLVRHIHSRNSVMNIPCNGQGWIGNNYDGCGIEDSVRGGGGGRGSVGVFYNEELYGGYERFHTDRSSEIYNNNNTCSSFTNHSNTIFPHTYNDHHNNMNNINNVNNGEIHANFNGNYIANNENINYNTYGVEGTLNRLIPVHQNNNNNSNNNYNNNRKRNLAHVTNPFMVSDNDTTNISGNNLNHLVEHYQHSSVEYNNDLNIYENRRNDVDNCGNNNNRIQLKQSNTNTNGNRNTTNSNCANKNSNIHNNTNVNHRINRNINTHDNNVQIKKNDKKPEKNRNRNRNGLSDINNRKDLNKNYEGLNVHCNKIKSNDSRSSSASISNNNITEKFGNNVHEISVNKNKNKNKNIKENSGRDDKDDDRDESTNNSFTNKNRNNNKDNDKNSNINDNKNKCNKINQETRLNQKLKPNLDQKNYADRQSQNGKKLKKKNKLRITPNKNSKKIDAGDVLNKSATLRGNSKTDSHTNFYQSENSNSCHNSINRKEEVPQARMGTYVCFPDDGDEPSIPKESSIPKEPSIPKERSSILKERSYATPSVDRNFSSDQLCYAECYTNGSKDSPINLD